MNAFVSGIYLVSCVAWIAAVFLLPRTKRQENALIWLTVSFVFYECWAAFVCGLLSLAHIPAGLISMAVCNLVSAAVIFVLYRRLADGAGMRLSPKGVWTIKGLWTMRQRFVFPAWDIVFVALLTFFVIYAWRERFGQDAAIIYGTIDPADRISRAFGVLAEETVIGPYPNMYFGHITNALFLGAAEPFFPGVYAIRAFEIKEMINVWLAGLLFFAALRQLRDTRFTTIIFMVLAFAYTLGFPWNNELWGFGYLGLSVTLIIFVQMGVRFLNDAHQRPVTGLLMVSAGCFGVGITYTMFAPPVYIAAFLAILLWKKQTVARLMRTEICVFAVPVIFTLIFTVLIGRGEAGTDLGAQFMIEGAIYRNLLGDFLIWMPFALFALVFAARKRNRDFSWIFAIVFFVYQAYFLYRMIDGTVSSYYYYKLHFVTWYIALFLAGAAIVPLTQDGSRRVMAMIVCYLLVFFAAAVFTVRGYDYTLSERGENINPIFAANGLFGLYANNNAYFNNLSVNPIYYRWDFLALCDAAQKERAAQDGAGAAGDFHTNRVEIITDSFADAYWADALTGEHIEQKPISGIDFMPTDEATILIVLKNSELYKENAAEIDSLQKVFENDLGFVIVRGSGIL